MEILFYQIEIVVPYQPTFPLTQLDQESAYNTNVFILNSPYILQIYDSPFGEREYKNETKIEQAIVPIRIPKDDFIDMPPFSPLSCRQPLSARSIGTPFATTKEYHVITPSFEILNSALIFERNKPEHEEKKDDDNNPPVDIPQPSIEDLVNGNAQAAGEEVEQTPEMLYDALFESVIYSTNVYIYIILFLYIILFFVCLFVYLFIY